MNYTALWLLSIPFVFAMDDMLPLDRNEVRNLIQSEFGQISQEEFDLIYDSHQGSYSDIWQALSNRNAKKSTTPKKEATLSENLAMIDISIEEMSKTHEHYKRSFEELEKKQTELDSQWLEITQKILKNQKEISDILSQSTDNRQKIIQVVKLTQELEREYKETKQRLDENSAILASFKSQLEEHKRTYGDEVINSNAPMGNRGKRLQDECSQRQRIGEQIQRTLKENREKFESTVKELDVYHKRSDILTKAVEEVKISRTEEINRLKGVLDRIQQEKVVLMEEIISIKYLMEGTDQDIAELIHQRQVYEDQSRRL